MICTWFRRTLPVSVLVLPLLLGLSSQVAAQQQTTPEQAQPTQTKEGVVTVKEEVTVTGTLIPREDLTSLSPVAVISPEEVTAQGTGRIEDLIQNLPQAFTAQNASISNGASGTATVQLRNLGSVRTLALLNGRRMASGNAAGSLAADLNFIPTALVKRVDVLTGGASAAYGADAVAGVVNFILDTEFEGFRGEAHWNGFQHNNNNETARELNAARSFTVPTGSTWNNGGYNFNLAVGGKIGEGKGHATAFVDYRDIKAILKDTRDYTNCSVQSLSSTGAQCGGSGTWQNGWYSSAFGDFVLDPSTGNTDTFRPRQSTDVYNFAPANFMQRNDTKWSGGAFAHYTVNEHFEPYAEVMVMDDVSDAQIAPTGTFFTTDHINCDNPMLSAQERALICGDQTTGDAELYIGKRNVEGGPRSDHLRHTNWRLLGGFRGDINPSWSYDVYGLKAAVNAPDAYLNDFSIDRLQDALLVEGTPGQPDTWRCRSGNAGCAPYNVFTVGGITQASLDYIDLVYLYNSGTDTKLLSGLLRGDLGSAGIKFPSATEAVQLAVGAEVRKETLFFTPDEVNQVGGATGQGGAQPAVDGNYVTKEGFAELLVPLVQDTTGAHDLSLDLGYRFQNYKASEQETKNNSSYKAMLSYAPVDGFRLRGGFNRAVRAPNVQELFAPQSIGLGGTEDICAGPNPGSTPEQCARTGVRPEQYGHIQENPAGQYNSYDGGNPQLDVERADTITAGFVWTPKSITGLTLTVDYYDIKIKDTISAFAPDDTVRACAERGDPGLCSLIHRDARGTLWLVGTYPDGAYTISTNQNIGDVRAKGFDVGATYPWNLGSAGYVNLSFVGSNLRENSLDNPLVNYDCAGFMGNQCGNFRGPMPKWRHRARAVWNTKFKATFGLGWRMLGPVTNDDFSDDPDLRNEGTQEALIAAGSDKFPAYHWFDLTAAYRFRDKVLLTVGCNNILDKEPPLGAGLSDIDYGPGYFGAYDYLGRTVYANLQFQF